MPGPSSDLRARVRAWIAEDPEPADRARLQTLLDAGADGELAARFGSELQFGTAGLRGRLGAGPARMNRATVRRATAGVARHLLDEVPGASQTGVVIGHDARHGSARFAEEAARVLTGAGLRARALPANLPTPVLAFATRHLGCAAGVMITASHNPPQDNGYKLYLADGAQIVPPVDRSVARRIHEVERLSGVPLGPAGEPVGDEVVYAYLEAIADPLSGDAEPHLSVVYTALHGVGRATVMAAFERAGIRPPHVVAAQAEPDPDFPTVARPNPQEPGALDLALAEAERIGADLALANDPDADRLAAAIPDPDGGWRVLTGDEVGALLGHHLLATSPDPAGERLATTVASSRLLRRIAAEYGAEYRETLTGFKWLMHSGPDGRPDPLRFAYEEALGYAVSPAVRDKDGISAALLLYRVAQQARRDGTDLAGRLDALAVRFGLHATREASIELPGGRAEEAAEMMRRLREHPPRRLLGAPVTRREDLLDSGKPPAADVLLFECGERVRVVARPSGTEPKLKLYLQVVERMAPADRRARHELDVLEAAMRAAVIR